MVVLRSQIRYGTADGGTGTHRSSVHIHRNADRLQKLPLLPAPRVFPPHPLRVCRKKGRQRRVSEGYGILKTDDRRDLLLQFREVFEFLTLKITVLCDDDTFRHVPAGVAGIKKAVV